MSIFPKSEIVSVRDQIGLWIARTMMHELNNIFAGINGFAQLAKEETVYLNDLLEVVNKEGKRGARLVRLFQEFIHRKPGEIGEIELRSEIEKLLEFFERNWTQKGIQWKIEISQDDKITLDWFRLELFLARTFLELCSFNSAKLFFSAHHLREELELDLTIEVQGLDFPENFFVRILEFGREVFAGSEIGLFGVEEEEVDQTRYYGLWFRLAKTLEQEPALAQSAVG